MLNTWYMNFLRRLFTTLLTEKQIHQVIAMATALANTFFEEPEEDILHGQVKRIMYKKYLQAYIPITQKFFNTIVIDGFAGQGRYGNEWPDTIEKYGSPLIALMVSLNYCLKKQTGEDVNWKDVAVHLENNDVSVENTTTTQEAEEDSTDEQNYIRLLFVEKDRKNFDALKENVLKLLSSFFHEYGKPGMIEVHEEDLSCTYWSLQREYNITCTIVNKSFQEFVPPDVDHWTRCLTFADPFGYTHTPMAHLLNFCGPRSELLINLMSSYVNRFVSRNAQGVAELYGITDEFKDVAAEFGIEPPDYENEDEIADFVKAVIRGEETGSNTKSCAKRYEKLLSRKSKAEYSLTFEMVGKTNQIIYHLIFITHHMKGLNEMKESMNRCTQFEGEMRMSDFDVVRWGRRVTLGNDQNDDAVADAIFQEFRSRTTLLSVVEKFVWLETPYVFRKKPLSNMCKDGRIASVLDPSRNPPKRRGTFPGSGDSWKLSFKADD